MRSAIGKDSVGLSARGLGKCSDKSQSWAILTAYTAHWLLLIALLLNSVGSQWTHFPSLFFKLANFFSVRADHTLDCTSLLGSRDDHSFGFLKFLLPGHTLQGRECMGGCQTYSI